MGRLDGKVAFITGGARGQGRAIACKFAREGANIVICDVDRNLATIGYDLASSDDMATTVGLVEDLGANIVAEVADVRHQDQIDRVVAAGMDAFGKIDILVANAGICTFKPFWEIEEAEWRDVVETNLSGVWRSAKALAPHMIERGDGVMIFTASINGVEGGPGYLHYVAAKHGVIGTMRGAALELGPHNIRVHAVLPGTVNTTIANNPTCRDWTAGHEGATQEEFMAATRNWHILRGRTALPPEAIADGMIWLVSDEARHTTGMELVIDAGHTLMPGLNMNPIADDTVMEPPAAPVASNARD